MKNRLIGIVLAALILSATAAFGAVKEGDLSISPVIGGYTFEGKQHLDTSLVYGVRAGYNFTNAFGAEALFDYALAKSNNGKGKADLYRYGGDLLYHFMPDNRLVPYVAAGFSGINFYGAHMNRNTRGALDYGVGLKYFINDNIALRGDVRHILYSYSSTIYNNLEYTLGAYIPFGGVKPAPKPVEPPPVQQATQPKAAPAAPQIVVEPAPKPSSTLSVVPATVTKGQSARLNWTSLNADKCDIKPGIGPVPVQGDTVITPDSDASYTLTCAGEGGTSTSSAAIAVTMPPVKMSAKKAKAMERFCNKPAVVSVLFDTNKAVIKPKYTADINELGEFLQDFPNAKGEISGHTDNVGGKAFNIKLSQRRADSVKQYIQKNFSIAPERLTIKGFGFSKPVASNKTKAGKAKNRRIETNFACE